MRRFLLSFLFVGVLSVVFSFTAFANWTDSVTSAYMGSGQASFNHKVSYSVSANPGDVWYFDVSYTWYGETISNPSNGNITYQIYNKSFNKSQSLVALGSNYGAADVTIEGDRVWLVFNQSVSSVTVTLQFNYSFSWKSGTFNGTPEQDLSNCIATTTVNARCGSIKRSRSGLPSLSSLNNKLDQVLEALGSSPYPEGFLGPDAILYFSSRYFDQCYDGAFIQPNEDGYFQSNGSTQSGVSFLRKNNTVDVTLQSGDYLFSYSLYANSAPDPSNIKVHGIKLSNVVVDRDWQYTNLYRIVGILHLESTITAREFIVDVGVLYASGVFYGGIVPLSSDFIAGSALNPEQDGLSKDIDDAGHKQSQQESDMWQNINQYKSDISFGLDGWDEASNGLSYVTGVFMTVWNNSPTQPIVLSLMLGIAMLSIGRGVMAAVRVQRNRRGD